MAAGGSRGLGDLANAGEYLLPGRSEGGGIEVALEADTLSHLSLWVASPALLFSLLADTAFEAPRWAALAGGTVWIATGTALLAWAYRASRGVGRVQPYERRRKSFGHEPRPKGSSSWIGSAVPDAT